MVLNQSFDSLLSDFYGGLTPFDVAFMFRNVLKTIGKAGLCGKKVTAFVFYHKNEAAFLNNKVQISLGRKVTSDQFLG